MTIDALCFLGVSRFGYQLNAADLVRTLDAEGIATAVVAPVHPRDHDFAAANTEIAAVAGDSGGRLVPLARIDPWDGEAAVDELARAVDGGARGVFLHPAEEYFQINDVRLRPVAERAGELGVPVIVATGFHCLSEAIQVGRFAEWCPDVPVVMTNGGQLNISGLAQSDAEIALGAPNVHILTNGVYRDDFLERTVRNFGADRVLFGSCAPRFEVAYEHRRVHQVHISDEERAQLLSGNASRLFGIGVPA
ncbi:amidohydrolase family protein [Pseudonocardia aurantiaca]|uniref:Amidohydrolase family protein n=1 Tax=Pseudonocardia aurantiaca TaxID=75290 RepID=A0ABW4FRP9_9PSEU